jgi:tetratricopeptide (TPR) repeat protein
VKQTFLQLSTFELEKAHNIERYSASRYYTTADTYLYWALHGADDAFEKALILYEKAAQLSPRNVLVYNRWSLALILKGDVEQAAEKLDIATTIDPGWVGNSMISGIMLYNEEHIDEAAEILITPIDENPADLRYFIEMCFYFNSYDMVVPIEEVLTEYCTRSPNDWASHAMRGITNYCLNIPDGSLNEFDTAMSLVPDEYAGDIFRSTLTLAGYSKIYKGMLSVIAPDWRAKLSRTSDAEGYLKRLDELSVLSIESKM